MPVLYATVARGTTVLVNYAACQGNFTEVTDQILPKVPPENTKLTYSHDNYLFHYTSEDKIVYLCITDDEFERSRAFMFLREIKRKFQTTYGARAYTALPFAMNSEFSPILANEMRHYSEETPIDRLGSVQADVDDLNRIMVRNIESLSNRGERLELLIDKTENLETTSLTFRKSSKTLARSMCIKNCKLTVILVVVITLIIYFIVSAACGGLAWPHCV
ncbi:vesicle-associated membrane protein 7-like [Patiria miniata]|uniref:Vesicle-associated membrane protein 7 n=1 Tax=Patiria miniata TaxID=46514 RepID=A0A914A2S1_PATMI|nr:vesicle-associated membrane protein 7-like [Patiria miniata]